ncbi:MAG TPA: CDP-alcohol phosphatidyltransferase family protein [Chloroflexota bacterium]
MLDRFKAQSKALAEAVARAVAWTGVSPTQLTLLGFALNVGVAVVLAAGLLPLGGALSLLAGAFDTLDGALARIAKRSTTFGAFLDSTVDRYAEAALLLGLLIDASRRGDLLVSAATYVVIVGSLMVSYTRARAEGLGLKCEVGIAPRPERVIILALGLILGLELPALIILAVLTNVTAIQRILHVRGLTAPVPPPRPASPAE